MITSGYTLDLYCDHENDDHEYGEFPHTFFNESRTWCWKEARKTGWILHRDWTATCPKCSKKLLHMKDKK